MSDHTTDIEKFSDSKEAAVVETAGKRGPYHYEDGVPRSKGVMGKAGFP